MPDDVADAGVAAAEQAGADAVVAFGGGSPIGLGKAIALRREVLLAAVPTTYSGSEMTNIWGLTGPDGKRTGRDERVRPRLIIYDPELTYGMPVPASMTSGFNAMAHAVEATYAQAVDDATLETAERSIRLLAEHLPGIAADAANPTSRAGALYGAYLAGSTIAAGLAIHHKLCHVLGGSFGLPHAPTHSVVLPHALHYNRDAAPDAMARVATALGADDAAGGVYDLQRRVGAPASLRELGLDAADLDRAADLATRNAYYNPRPIDRDSIRALLGAAHAGTRPGAG